MPHSALTWHFMMHSVLWKVANVKEIRSWELRHLARPQANTLFLMTAHGHFTLKVKVLVSY